MNNKGFTLIELLATIVIIAIIMGIVLPSASRVSRDNQNRLYKEYEKMMAEYALISSFKGEDVIPLSNLSELDKVKHDCTGYAKRISLSPLKYKGYIKCDKYTTTDYNSNLDG